MSTPVIESGYRAPLTGRAWVAPASLTPIPTLTNLADADWPMPAAFVELGDNPEDSGPVWTRNAAELTKLFQAGKKFSPQTGTATCALAVANQLTDAALSVLEGTAVTDAGLAVDVDRVKQMWVLTETVYKNDKSGELTPHRCLGLGTLDTLQRANAKGSPASTSLSWTFEYSDEIHAHYLETDVVE